MLATGTCDVDRLRPGPGRGDHRVQEGRRPRRGVPPAGQRPRLVVGDRHRRQPGDLVLVAGVQAVRGQAAAQPDAARSRHRAVRAVDGGFVYPPTAHPVSASRSSTRSSTATGSGRRADRGVRRMHRLEVGRRALIIERIDLVAVRVPLDRTYRGSKYRMTHRSTIITQVHTSAGVVGEAYAGDEDAGLAEIVAIIRDEIAPQLIGLDARAVERCWEVARPATQDILRDRRLGLVACACVDTAIWDAIGKASANRCGGCGAAIATRSRSRRSAATTAPTSRSPRRSTSCARRGLAGMKFKVGGLTPAEDAERFRRGAQGRGRRLHPDGRRQSGLAGATRPSSSPAGRRSTTSTGSRSRASGRTTVGRCATCG